MQAYYWYGLKCNSRYFDTIADIDIRTISTDVYQKYQKAIVTQKRVRVAAPDLRKEEQLELFRILLDDKTVVYGFTNKQIRSKMSGNPKTEKIAYELRKLRERGAIKKSKGSNNYQLTQEGYVWLYYSLFNQNYFISPLLSISIKKSKKGQAENPSNIEIYDFLKSKNVENLDSFDVFKMDENALKKQSKKEEKQHISQQISSLTQKHEKSANITIATPSKNYQERNEKVRNGIFTHEILAKINTKNDVEKVLKSYLLEGLITETEKQEIAERIFEIIEKHPKYFAENQEILSERELMIEGKTYRPDRMVKIDNAWFIIDFKTGNPSENHQKQIDLYQSAMENLGRKIGGKELIYL